MESKLRDRQTPSIVILTGAGISAESGIKTFRDAGGLWENHAVEDVATPQAFKRDPRLVHQFYNARRGQLRQPAIKPNAAHMALATLEQNWPGEFLLITQNVDDLHERAGSKKVLHMHGELKKVRCLKSSQIFQWEEDITDASKCTCCSETDTLRPHIVWFGEIPLGLDEIFARLENCDLFLAVGTSGQVYPAAGFVAHVAEHTETVEINLTASANQSLFDHVINGPASTEVPRFVERLLSLRELMKPHVADR